MRLWVKTMASPTPATVASTKAVTVILTVNHRAGPSTSQCSKKARPISEGVASTSGEMPSARTRSSQNNSAAAKVSSGVKTLSQVLTRRSSIFVPQKVLTGRLFVLHLIDGVRMGRGQAAVESAQAWLRFRRCRPVRLGKRRHRPRRAVRLRRGPVYRLWFDGRPSRGGRLHDAHRGAADREFSPRQSEGKESSW